jgi:hypothetical protein
MNYPVYNNNNKVKEEVAGEGSTDADVSMRSSRESDQARNRSEMEPKDSKKVTDNLSVLNHPPQ